MKKSASTDETTDVKGEVSAFDDSQNEQNEKNEQIVAQNDPIQEKSKGE